MKRLIAVFLCFISLLPAASAELTRNQYLDAAFTLIEEGNIFLERYNEITGAGVEAKFPNGVPYFFGGNNYDLLYTTRQCWETTKFYRKDARYIYGFDCSGYTRWINSVTGREKHPGLQDMILNYSLYGKYHVFSHRAGQTMPAFDQLQYSLKVGDYLVAKHGARHIMMYIGTPRDYGFTADNAPEIADYLDYPLVIHCGANPFYGERFDKFIAENEKYKACLTTNGGVCVSILGVKAADVPHKITVQNADYSYFLVGDDPYMLTLWDLDAVTSYVWYRMEGKDN